MIKSPIVPIILCGGSGTRLWPLSRESFPKQFLSIDSDDKESLLQKTYSRISKLENLASPIFICNEEHRFIVAEHIRNKNIKDQSIILEPCKRNTAPAITLAALKSLQNGEDGILLVMASDHEINNQKKFLEVVRIGIKYAENNKLVTLGIIPSYPNTGYGYIKSKEPFNLKEIEGVEIEKFLEKPSLIEAKKFIQDKTFSWNSGIFLFKAKTIIEEIEKYAPDILKTCKKSLEKSKFDLDFQRIDKNSFYECPNAPIDVAVMEKTNKGIVVPLDAGWSDIGSWETIWEISKKDKEGNFKLGKVLTEDTKDSYIRSENRLVVGIGLKNLVVVETNDAILIADKKNSQKVKNVVENLKEKNIREGQSHSKVFRPWGYYLSVNEGPRWQVKLIKVNSGEKLSLQMHHHRSEHWIIVSGTAEVEINEKITVLTENESIYIPLGSKHRLSNPGKIPLTLIEVQSGAYVGEDDIVRFSDKYGRDD